MSAELKAAAVAPQTTVVMVEALFDDNRKLFDLLANGLTGATVRGRWALGGIPVAGRELRAEDLSSFASLRLDAVIEIEFHANALFELRFDVGEADRTLLAALDSADRMMTRFLYNEGLPGAEECEVDLPRPSDPDGCIKAAIAWRS